MQEEFLVSAGRKSDTFRRRVEVKRKNCWAFAVRDIPASAQGVKLIHIFGTRRCNLLVRTRKSSVGFPSLEHCMTRCSPWLRAFSYSVLAPLIDLQSQSLCLFES